MTMGSIERVFSLNTYAYDDEGIPNALIQLFANKSYVGIDYMVRILVPSDYCEDMLRGPVEVTIRSIESIKVLTKELNAFIDAVDTNGFEEDTEDESF